MKKLDGEIIGLDLGLKRTGVARLNTVARIAEPLKPIDMDDGLVTKLSAVVAEHETQAIVAGMPRGLNGQETEQTAWAQKIVEELRAAFEIPVFTIDEAATTKFAEERAFKDQSIDSVAATIIVEDFVNEVLKGNIENVSL